MFITLKYGDRNFRIHPYNSKTEKEILTMQALGTTLIDVLELLGIERSVAEKLTIDEQMAILYKYRELSVGDIIPIKFTCKKCSKVNEKKVSIENIIVDSDFIPSFDVIDQYKELNDDNINDFVKFNVDELDIDQYKQTYEQVEKAIVKFNFTKSVSCASCKHVHKINFADPDKILEYMSEDSIEGLYQIYSDLVFFGKFSKLDIDSMLPFERTVFMNLLNETRAEMAK